MRSERDRVEPNSIRGLFVVGSPRSGTTLLGNYLGSAASVRSLGEYGGFFVAHRLSAVAMPPARRRVSPFREQYLARLSRHAREFAEQKAADENCAWYCDAGPWNLLVADAIASDQPNALFVLTLRHYAGTIQSLRSWSGAGYESAGKSWAESAGIWASHYGLVPALPADRTVVVSFDDLMRDPVAALDRMHSQLEQHGFDVSSLDQRQLAVSHAALAVPRPTIGTVEHGRVTLNPVPSFDADHWSGDIQMTVWPQVKSVHSLLRRKFPTVYSSPVPPARMKFHDEWRGLVPLRTKQW